MQGERRCRGEGVEGLPDGFKEETSSFTALFRVPGECLWIQVSAALVVDDMGGVDQQMLAEQLPTEMGGLRTSLAMLWTPALPTPTLRRQTRWLVIRAPPVGSWP